METSDSECFESADEDFEYDKKLLTVKKDDVKLSSNLESVTAVTEKIQDITIKTLQTEEEVNTDVTPILKVSAEKPPTEEPKKNRVQRKEQKEQRSKKEVKPKLGTKLGQKLEAKNVEPQASCVSKREECWEPGVNYSKTDDTKNESTNRISSKKKENEKANTNSDKSVAEPESSKRNIEPKREQCYEPGLDYMESDEDECEHEPVKTILPRREECWEPGVDYVEDNEPMKNIPPKREECWEPGMNYTEDDEHVKSSSLPSVIKPKLNPTAAKEEEESMWDADDDWETVPSIKTAPEKNPENANQSSANTSSGWGGWGNWGGVSSILSTATHGVTTLTSHVSQGITTVLESGIGVPDPEELARLHKSDRKEEPRSDEDASAAEIEDTDTGPTIQTVFGLGNLVSGVSHITKLVETTSSKVLTGGLDTLEVIGKKTMEVLQEGDPGLKKKRAYLTIKQNKPVLSQILREAKEKREAENKLLEERHYQKKANYETLFDDNQGLVHLEALEMLSKQCDIKLETIVSTYGEEQLKEMQETMSQVKELCEMPELDDDEEQLTGDEIRDRLAAAVTDLNVPINYDRLNATWAEAEAWLEVLNVSVCNERELHQQAIETLAHLTALSVEQFHKAGELLLIKEHRSTADEADSLVQ